jgi:hypothetical protein
MPYCGMQMIDETRVWYKIEIKSTCNENEEYYSSRRILYVVGQTWRAQDMTLNIARISSEILVLHHGQLILTSVKITLRLYTWWFSKSNISYQNLSLGVVSHTLNISPHQFGSTPIVCNHSFSLAYSVQIENTVETASKRKIIPCGHWI